MNTSFFTSAQYNITNQETSLQNLESQLATGTSVGSAAANPTAFITAAKDTGTVQTLGADNQNQTIVQANLGVATGALSNVSNALDSLQAIALQALNATTNSGDYAALASQVAQIGGNILSTANTQDTSGNYVFGGTAAATEPFVSSSSGVSYVGQSGISNVEISPGVVVNASIDGSSLTSGFSGNGYASVSAGSSNTGTATLLATGVSNQGSATAFQQGTTPITVSFSAGSGGKTIYTATQGTTTLATGPATSGSNITLAGVQFQLTDQAAAGDTFTISPSRPQSVFSLVKTIQSALSSPSSTPAGAAQVNQILGNALGSITQYQAKVSSTQAKLGLVIKTVTQAGTANATSSASLQSDAANLTSANIPSVLTQLSDQTTSLQAALKAFANVATLSLFAYV